MEREKAGGSWLKFLKIRAKSTLFAQNVSLKTAKIKCLDNMETKFFFAADKPFPNLIPIKCFINRYHVFHKVFHELTAPHKAYVDPIVLKRQLKSFFQWKMSDKKAWFLVEIKIPQIPYPSLSAG